jgi:hypothetical protein
MQRELDAACNPDSCGPTHSKQAIQVVGLNRIGSESGNSAITAGRIAPWLQDTASEQVWEVKWRATIEDVIILDEENHRYATFNLGAYDLSTPANYQALKALLQAAAHRSPP